MPKVPAEAVSPRQPAHLLREGERTSIELALNSRCSSDYDGDPGVFHWGMFDGSSRLSDEQIARIAGLAGRFRVSEDSNRIGITGNSLAFLIGQPPASDFSGSVMVGSGMQQQAACLASAALGIGTQFNALGTDGAVLPSGEFAAVRIHLAPAKPSYRGSFWTAATPDHERPWLPGNLPDPRRDGTRPLLGVLLDMSFDCSEGIAATRSEVGQLLWAARGRTPHFYKSRPWGLTIPTWQGNQNISAVYVASGPNLYQYVNWQKGRPTHSVKLIETASSFSLRLHTIFPLWDCFIILGTDDSHARGLWEVGYQLLNVLLQASGLGLKYQTIMLHGEQREMFSRTPIMKPVMTIALRLMGEKHL